MQCERSNAHASKLPVRKSRNSMRVRAVNKHGRLVPGLSSVFDKSVAGGEARTQLAE